MASEGGRPSASTKVAEVLIDSVGLSRVFTYSLPERFKARIGIGSYVSVPLGNLRVRGWIVGLAELAAEDIEALGFELSPIFRLLGGGPNPEVIALCKWAAWRFIGSPVNFLTHASPKKRVASRPGGELDFKSCGRRFIHERGESVVVRIPPGHSRYNWILDHLGDPSQLKGQVIVVCPSQAVVSFLASRLARSGYTVALFPEEFEAALEDAQVVIGARNAAFASVSNLSEVIVVDADDPAHSETSAPAWSSYEVARARVDKGQRALLLSSAPTVDMMRGSKTMALSRSEERSGWPKVLVGNISETTGGNPLVSSDLIAQINSGLRLGVRPPSMTAEGLIDYDGVIVLYNRLGGARTLVCQKCNRVVTCTECSTILTQDVPSYRRRVLYGRGEINRRVKESLVITALSCPRCQRGYPAICTSCMSTSLKVVTFGIERFRALLEAAVGKPVSEVKATSELNLEGVCSVTLGTEAVFSRFRSAKMVVLADFDHYLYAPSLAAREVAFSLLARAARLVPPRSADTGCVPIYIQTRDVQNPVIKAALDGDPRRFISEEAQIRKRLGLPPFGAIVRCFGPRSAEWIARSGINDRDGVEVIPVREGVFDLRSRSLSELLEILAELRSKASMTGVRFSTVSV
ncbi:MAG: hypothetical protein M0Z39_10675 [Actinomycetota bacterium]|nr:hypothetical protein [Actinomycetota bacterium]